MTFVHAMREATSVSVGVGPILVPSRSLGSSMTVFTSRVEMSVREYVGQSPWTRWVMIVFSFVTVMTDSSSWVECDGITKHDPRMHRAFLIGGKPRRRCKLHRGRSRSKSVSANRLGPSRSTHRPD